jgi:PAS domain S-box-containing protein
MKMIASLDPTTCELMFDAVPAHVVVLSGEDLEITYTNASFRNAAGTEDILGHNFGDFMSRVLNTEDMGVFAEVYATGKGVDIPNFEVQLITPLNESIQLFYRLTVQPLGPKAIVCFAYDVTDHVAESKRADENERHLSFAMKIGQSVGIFEWDVSRDAVVVDKQFLNVFGLPAELSHAPLPLVQFIQAIHEDDRDRVAAAISKTVETGCEYEEQFRVSGADNASRYVLAKGECQRTAFGTPGRFTGVVFDISRQYRDEVALRESEARLRSVMNSLDKGYCIAEMIRDPEGKPIDYRYIEINPRFEEMTGLKDATGHRMLDLVPNLEEKWARIYGRVAYEGETVHFEDYSEAMGRWFSCFATPVQPYGRFAVVFKDTTEERAIQDALLKSEAEFRTITEAMPHLVFRANIMGELDFCSPSLYEFTGLSPKDGDIGGGFAQAIHAEDFQEAVSLWSRSLKSGEAYDHEFRLRHHSGEYRWVLTRTRAVHDKDGNVLQWLGTCTDIHELKLAQEEKQLMLGEMNHRVKNSLAMVHAMVSQTLRQADNIQDASNAIQSRISMMARAHDRLVSSNWLDAHITEVVEAAIDPHRSKAHNFVISGPDLRIGSKQSLALTMALHELATNATKYGALHTPEGTVEITWDIRNIDGQDIFSFSWTEVGGPLVEKPTRKGFGSRMIEQAVAVYFNGEAELEFAPEGLKYNLRADANGVAA